MKHNIEPFSTSSELNNNAPSTNQGGTVKNTTTQKHCNNMVATVYLRVLVIGLLVVGGFCQGETPIKCIKCDPTNAKCATSPSDITDTCDTGKCFVRIDSTNGQVTRGCLPTTEEAACTSPNCKLCDTGNCNNWNVCYNCSSNDNEVCAKSPTTVKALSICEAQGTQCAITIDKDGNTVRRCATAADVTTGTTATNDLCSGGLCNTNIIPKDRLQCFQCQSNDANCASLSTLTALPCAKYVADDKCYMHAKSADAFTRGCVSDQGASNPCSNPTSDALCLTCNTADCNKQPYTIEQELRCIQCNSTSNGACAFGPFADSTEKCVNPIPYNSKGACYTQFHDQNVYRGCSNDRDTTLLGSDCTDANKCTQCTEANCNNKQEKFTCIRCRSTMQPDCAEHADRLTGSLCDNEVTAENAKCYHGIWSNVVIRGCYVDADERQQGVCDDNTSSQCILCGEPNCNTKPSSAVRFNLRSVLLMLPIMWVAIETHKSL